MKKFYLLFFLVINLYPQTKIDLKQQGKNADFTNFPFTKPFQTSGSLPITCSVNSIFLKVDGLGGYTLWICDTVNHWAQIPLGGSNSLSFNSPLTLNSSTVDCPTCLKTGSSALAANQITFTYNSATGSIDGLKVIDSSGNTGTGILGRFSTATGSLMTPWRADANGIGWKVAPDGSFQPVGQTVAGSILLKRGTSQTAFGMEGSTAGTWGIIVPTTFTSWNWTPPTSPCGLHSWWTTDVTGIGSCTQPNFTDLIGSVTVGQLPASVVINPMTGLGDMIVSGAGGAVTRLPGTTGYLHFTGSIFQFDTPAGGGGGGGGGGTSFDPLDTTTINSHTDFNCRQLTSTATGTSNAIIGCGFTWTYINRVGAVTAADTLLTDDTDGNHPSDFKFTTDATSNALTQILPTFGTTVPKSLFMKKSWDMQWVGFYSSITNARWAFGLCSSNFGSGTTAFCNDEMFVVYDSATSGNWAFRTGAGSAWDAQISTGVAATTGFHKVKLSWDATLVKATVIIDGTTVNFCASGCTATLGTHIPAVGTAMYPAFYFGSNGTGTGNYFAPVQFGMALKGLVM